MFWIIAVIIVALPSYLIRFSILGIPTTLLEILLYLGFLSLLVIRPLAETGARWSVVAKRYLWPIVLILVGGLIGFFVAPDKRAALGLFKAYLIDPILLFWMVIGAWKNGQADQKNAQTRLVAIGLALTGLLVAVSVKLIPGAMVEGRAIGLYILDSAASPNFLALYLSPIAGFLIGWLIQGYRLQDKLSVFLKLPETWLSLLALVAIKLAILSSGSRGGLLAYAGVLIIALLTAWILQLKPKNQSLGFSGLILVAIIGMVGVAWLSRPNFMANATVRQQTSNNLRYEIWRTTIVDILPKKLLTGVGLANYQTYFHDITLNRVNFPEFISPWAVTPHNLILTWLVNFGILGTVGFVWLLILAGSDIIRDFERPLAWGVGFGLMAFLLHGLVDSGYWKNDLAALFWLLIALAAVLHKEKPKNL